MIFQTNPQLEIAFNYVRYTNKNVFLTGKAGTGKTTFLHQLKKDSHKRMVIVAPTGVAAINAGGVTIHSFFQLPFGPFLPDTPDDATRQRKFKDEKIKLIRSLDLLVIDEISMVRADLLDGIDHVLRRYKDRSKPFGGVQLLMIGDLHQLPPVVKDEEWAMLQPHYNTAYFFGSRALQQTNPVAIELKHIYRQADSVFIDLLNKVRENQIDAAVLAQLNSRFIPGFAPTEAEPYITLTSHNAAAYLINGEKLNSISTPVHSFSAVIEGDFPPFSYPTEAILDFKVGAQVMFVKNDSSFEKLFYNGKIGKILEIGKEHILVACPNDPKPITVLQVEWQNLKYTLDESTKEVEEEVIGTFTQFPLKLAWAITIHKSQGLTFERAIIDANAAFAHGQVYVALSRCKTFEGIVLRSQIANSSIRTDSIVRGYSADIDRNAPTEADLISSKIAFQQTLINELFDFKAMKSQLTHAYQTLLSNDHTLNQATIDGIKAVQKQAETDVFAIADKFLPQIQFYFLQTGQPEENEQLQGRLQKAGVYFEGKLKKGLLEILSSFAIETDNKAVEKTAKEAVANLQKTVFIKNACFVAAQKGFSTGSHLRAKSDADLDFAASQSKATVAKAASLPANSPNSTLYERLKKWREQIADENDVDLYQVLPTKAIYELVEKLPTTLPELGQVKGIGTVKLQQFGKGIVQIIANYCEEYHIEKPVFNFSLPKTTNVKAPKIDTKRASFDLYKSGKTIAEIAAARGLVASTIEGHLAHFVAANELEITELMSQTAIDEIVSFFTEKADASSNEAFTNFSAKYTYSDLRMVQNYMKTRA
ncbi:MAG: hypothetical protein RI894_1797 [Bacteroidota bacterium]|jgi:hypothetical protein